MSAEPIYPHECRNCIYLGRSMQAPDGYDLYWCRGEHDGPLIKYGMTRFFYTFGMSGVGSGRLYNETFLRACAEGLVPSMIVREGTRRIESFEEQVMGWSHL